MNRTKKMVVTALLCALAYIATLIGRFPISSIGFLKYDPKDVVVVMGGFIYGPLTAVVISVAVSILEMISISETNVIGCIMNIVSTISFALTAALIYEKRRSVKGAVVGLFSAIFAMTITMIVWNYLLTPIFYGIPRGEVVKMLAPVFIPFNLIKSSINTALTLLIYKPFVRVLRLSGLVEQRNGNVKADKGVIILAAFILAMAICAVLIFK